MDSGEIQAETLGEQLQARERNRGQTGQASIGGMDGNKDKVTENRKGRRKGREKMHMWCPQVWAQQQSLLLVVS